jgi:eukaryotic-like serine/threonine-protein kinase
LRRRFEQEAKCLSALNHPHIATIYEFAQDEALSFIVMEYVPGRTLAETIPPGGFPAPLCLEYGIQIADGLATAHVAGIIHRDLKPSNVLITDRGSVKILDFGMAKVVKKVSKPLRPLTLAGTILGTAGYMSPEQARGNEADVRSDVFCLGAVLYEMLAGVPPFKRDSFIETMAAILKDDPPVPAKPVPPQVLRNRTAVLAKRPGREVPNHAGRSVGNAGGFFGQTT